MGKKAKNVAMSSKKRPVTETSRAINITTWIYTSLIVAVLSYALYHLTLIGAHLEWIYNPSALIEVERHVVNDSTSYQ